MSGKDEVEGKMGTKRGIETGNGGGSIDCAARSQALPSHRWYGWTDGHTVTCYRCWPRVVLFPDPAGTQAPRYPRAVAIGTAKAGERDVTTFSTSHIPATSGIAEDFAFRHSFVLLWSTCRYVLCNRFLSRPNYISIQKLGTSSVTMNEIQVIFSKVSTLLYF